MVISSTGRSWGQFPWCCRVNAGDARNLNSHVPSQQAQTAIRRASRGGLLSGPQLVAVSSVLRGGGRLRAAVSGVVGQATREGRPPELLGPLTDAVKVIHSW